MLHVTNLKCAGLLMVATLLACADDSETTGPGDAFGEDDVVAAFGSFTTTGFTKISNMPATTQHGNAPAAFVWAANDIAADYAAIDPSDSQATAGPFPEGSIIIKQHVDAADSPDGAATVLAKMAAGFNPDAADWWWGRFDTSGALAESGAIGYCIDCHRGNGFERTDFVRGIDADNK